MVTVRVRVRIGGSVRFWAVSLSSKANIDFQ